METTWMSWVSTYPYLFGSLVLLALFGLGCCLFPRHRLVMLASGLLAAPYALYAAVFVPEYWSPKQVVRWLAGPEDFLFSIAVGGLVWLVGASGSTGWVVAEARLWTVLRRSVAFGTLFYVVFSFLWLGGASVMNATLAAVIATLVGLITLRPDLRWMAVRGSLGFGCFYALFVGGFVMWTGALNEWNLVNLSNVLVLGAPVEEIQWAFAYGASWPVFVAYALDVRWKTSRSTV